MHAAQATSPRAVRLILASASPRRQRLLHEMGLSFDVRPSDVDEPLDPQLSPEQNVVGLAQRKARAATASSGDVVLAADTMVVAANGAILGKPCDAADAERCLEQLSGTTHRVLTGVCLLRGDPAFESTQCCTTYITMRSISAVERREYVESGEPFGKSGGYAVQETGDRFVTTIDGSWSNVVGLPVKTVRQMLAELAQFDA